jgi:dephospho-CoA kinase
MTEDKKSILGLVGTIGAGKSSAVEYLLTKGFDHIKLSNVIREKAKLKNPDRGTLQDWGNKLRQTFGTDFLAKEAWKKITRSKSKKFLIDGIRNVAEVRFLRGKENFHLICVDAHPKTRFKRLRIRSSSRDPLTLEEFKEMESRDLNENKEHGQQTKAAMRLADFSIRNDSPIEFFLKLEKIFKDISKK